jgi:hypothetical protein
MEERLDFWTSCISGPIHGKNVSKQAMDFYEKIGYRFHLPAPKQIQDILDALDANFATWDRDIPEYFFQMLELNFPDKLIG